VAFPWHRAPAGPFLRQWAALLAQPSNELRTGDRGAGKGRPYRRWSQAAHRRRL